MSTYFRSFLVLKILCLILMLIFIILLNFEVAASNYSIKDKMINPIPPKPPIEPIDPIYPPDPEPIYDILEVTGTKTLSGSIVDKYDKIYIKSGGKLRINSSQMTIKIDDFKIESGGELTYHPDRKDDKSMTVTLDVLDDVIINGKINFAGLKGSNGANGTGKNDDGSDGLRGKNGKNIIIKSKNKIKIKGTIDTSGGNGGKGGNGHDDHIVVGDHSSDGGDGGAGANAGKIKLMNAKKIDVSGIIKAVGGRGGNGGKGGDAGWNGSGKDGGNGNVGGNGGVISIYSLEGHLSVKKNAKIITNAGFGGIRGFGQDGGDSGSDASRGGIAGQINITVRNIDNKSIIISTDGGRVKARKNIYYPKGKGKNARVKVGYINNLGRFKPSNISLIKDKEKPKAPENIRLKNNNNKINLINSNGLINCNNPTLYWESAKDRPINIGHSDPPASGIKEYKIKLSDIKKDVVYTTSSHIKLANKLKDGKYNIKIGAYDYAGNFGDLSTISFTVDTTRPSNPLIQEESNVNKNGAIIKWNESSDRNKIDFYELEVYEKTNRGLKILAETQIKIIIVIIIPFKTLI